MLTGYVEKIKPLYGRVHRTLALLPSVDRLTIGLLIILASVTGFGAMRLWLIWPSKSPVIIEKNTGLAEIREAVKTKISINTENQKPQGQYVASKNGKAYHYPWCPGALKIKDENKIWFGSREGAEKTGYKPAVNCPGL